jgi:hypothetical protein
MKVRKAYDVLIEWQRWAYQNSDDTDEDSRELYEALSIALPLVREGIKCDRCGKAKAVELSECTEYSYCKRCWKAVTDGRTPY